MGSIREELYDFSNRVFDSAKKRVSEVLDLMERPNIPSSEQTLYMCYKCGSENISSIAKQVRSSDEGTSVFNSCNDCRNKWRDG